MKKEIINLILVLGGAILLILTGQNEAVMHVIGDEVGFAIGGLLFGAILIFGIIVAIRVNKPDTQPTRAEKISKEITWEIMDAEDIETRKKLFETLKKEFENGE